MNQAVVYLTATQTVHIGPANIDSVFLAGDGAAADAQIYDGQNTNGKQVIHMEAPSGESTPFEPSKPLTVHNGIHVVVNATTSKLTIIYTPLPKE